MRYQLSLEVKLLELQEELPQPCRTGDPLSDMANSVGVVLRGIATKGEPARFYFRKATKISVADDAGLVYVIAQFNDLMSTIETQRISMQDVTRYGHETHPST